MGVSDLEAVLFSAAKPISIDVIQDIFGLSKQDALEYVDIYEKKKINYLMQLWKH